jgi:hypothetical protein
MLGLQTTQTPLTQSARLILPKCSPAYLWVFELHRLLPHFLPVGGQHSAVALNKALHHGSPSVLITLVQHTRRHSTHSHCMQGHPVTQCATQHTKLFIMARRVSWSPCWTIHTHDTAYAAHTVAACMSHTAKGACKAPCITTHHQVVPENKPYAASQLEILLPSHSRYVPTRSVLPLPTADNCVHHIATAELC